MEQKEVFKSENKYTYQLALQQIAKLTEQSLVTMGMIMELEDEIRRLREENSALKEGEPDAGNSEVR